MPDYQSVRAQTVSIAASLLLGPREPGEVISSPPLDTYLTGILWPQGVLIDPLEDDIAAGAAGDDDGEDDAPVPGYRAIRPCSFGLTFTADQQAPLLVTLARTARYLMTETPSVTAGAPPQRIFTRAELGYSLTIPSGAENSWRTSDFVRADGSEVNDPDIVLHIKRRIVDGQQVVTLTLINNGVENDGRPRDEACFFQTGISVTARSASQSGAIRERRVLPLVAGDHDGESAALLYRSTAEFAVGHSIAAAWDREADGSVANVRTDWLPHAFVKGMDANGHPLLAELGTDHPTALAAEWLARRDMRAEIVTALRTFAGVYRQWIDDVLDPQLSALDDEFPAARRHRKHCEDALQRILRGVTTLETSDDAWRAFTLANAAMDRQARYAVKADKRAPLIWRPFQLAYMLLVLPGIADGDDDDRDCVDLLWFPTGGGKTEAYLGLTAFQIFLRRLTDAGRRDDGGVDVMMRYTLRLLTVQQFQRAASLICACDAIRREQADLGEAPISLGLYVGRDATPNRLDAAQTALADEHDGHEPRSTPRQLLNCPVCGEALSPLCYAMSDDGGTIEIRCNNRACETAGEPLPVLTVDDLIYENPTSLLIGTIDKFAQLPRSGRLRPLFGLDGGLRPGLIIQDELHLISGPLGSMAGLYETAIDLICTNDGQRPKVIGSTATIGQAQRQVRALFDRSVLQFPPSGFDAADSFFAVRDDRPGAADRIYMGVSSAGRSPKFALQATAAAFLQTAEHLRLHGEDEAALDAYWTAVLYFNSLRELGGAYVLMQDDVPRQMAYLATRLDGAGTQRVLEREPVELSSRVSSRDLPSHLLSLEAKLQANADPFAERPENTVLASNMISVGVDVGRLGLMIVNGQPKSTAEYIQATSRIGRGLHGLVVTLYNFGRPRDVSHYEHFAAYHSALYRGVEATSVTPWAPRARDKALHAVLAASVRYLVAGMEDDEAAGTFKRDDPEVQRLITAINARARSASGDIEGGETVEDLEARVIEWAQRVHNARSAGKRFLYWERPALYGRTLPHLMRSAEDGGRATQSAWPTPNSMREVEPSTAFFLKRFGRRQ
jgi:hypothetical protein